MIYRLMRHRFMRTHSHHGEDHGKSTICGRATDQARLGTATARRVSALKFSTAITFIACLIVIAIFQVIYVRLGEPQAVWLWCDIARLC